MKYLFLDTNIYLHYVDFEQIPWKELMHDDVTIVVPMTVIAEIDKKKDGSVGKIKTRARKVGAKFAAIFLDEVKCKNINVIRLDEPTNDFILSQNLRPEVNDDHIIASILDFKNGQDSIVVAYDNTMLIKAKAYNIRYYKLPDKYRLTEEKTEAEKERDEYKRQLAELENRKPDLRLCFANGKDILEITVPELLDVEAKVAEKMAKIRSEHHPLYRTVAKQKTEDTKPVPIETLQPIQRLAEIMNRQISSFQSIDPLLMYSDKQLEEYNAKLEPYYAECEKHYRIKFEQENITKQIVELEFNVLNTGTAMSGEMLISIFLPEGIEFYNNKSGSYVYTKKPVAPNVNGFSIDPSAFSIEPPTEWRWDLNKEVTKHTFNFRKSGIIQGTQQKIDFPHHLYINSSQPKDFVIGWMIADSASPQTIKGMLKVVVKKTK